MRRLRVLHVARNYPNVVLPRLGLWTERFVRASLGECSAEVIAPVPYWPPIPGPASFTRHRRVPATTERFGVTIHHPRFLTGPGSWLGQFDGAAFHASIKRVADRLHARQPFDVINAHFVYPEGWAAARLARRFGVPLVVTEHASWRPWLDDAQRVRRHAVEAAEQSRFIIAVSHALARTIAHFVDIGDRLRVIPNVVDDETFTLPDAGVTPIPNRLLFVGLIRRVKGLDVLLNAMRLLIDRGHDVHLDVIGESIYGSYQRDLDAVRNQVTQLRLDQSVRFLGGKEPRDVARELWTSAAPGRKISSP